MKVRSETVGRLVVGCSGSRLVTVKVMQNKKLIVLVVTSNKVPFSIIMSEEINYVVKIWKL